MEQSQFKRWYLPLYLISGGSKWNPRAFQSSHHLLWQIPGPKLETRASLEGRSSAGALGRTPLWAMPLSLLPFREPLLGCCYGPHAAFLDSARDKGKGRPRVALSVPRATEINTSYLTEMIYIRFYICVKWLVCRLAPNWLLLLLFLCLCLFGVMY